jgi:xylulokinase
MSGIGFLGLDVGTQGLKGVIIQPDGHSVWQKTVNYPTLTPRPGWNEQHPEDWQRALLTLLDAVASTGMTIQAIGLTGQMHTSVYCDDAGQPLRPAILWSDTRGADQVQQLIQASGEEALWARFGNLPLVNYTLIKNLWVQQEEPHIWSQVAHIAVAKDWIRFLMTGNWGSEVGDASGTYWLSVADRQWDHAWLEAQHIPEAWIGPVVESSTIVGLNRLGPPALHGIPVVAGSGDQPASALGTGVVDSDTIGISLGTSGVVFWPKPGFEPPPHASIHAFCHALPNQWYWMGVTQAAAYSLTWLHDRFAEGASYDAWTTEAGTAPPGADGLLFLPYLNGERAPINDPDARGVWFGLSSAHGRSHLIRSVLEGVAFSLKDVVVTMNADVSHGSHRIVATGGGVKSVLWSQILADVLETSIDIVEDPGAAVGAARLAQISQTPEALGEIRPTVTHTVDPLRDNQAMYSAAFAQYRELYQRVRPLFGR